MTTAGFCSLLVLALHSFGGVAHLPEALFMQDAANATTRSIVWAQQLPTTLEPIAQTAFLEPLQQATYLSPIEREIIAETNRLRANPAAYARELEFLSQYYSGKMLRLPGLPPIETAEGVAPVREAIAHLRRIDPLPPLSPSKGMSLAARDHVRDLVRYNVAGHYGKDGSDPSDRLSRYGTWGISNSENISYQHFESARWHILQLLIDDGVRSRTHREELLDSESRVTGVSCAEHPSFPSVCVITYAVEYSDRP